MNSKITRIASSMTAASLMSLSGRSAHKPPILSHFLGSQPILDKVEHLRLLKVIRVVDFVRYLSES